MEKQILELMSHIANDYAQWKSRGEYGSPDDYATRLKQLNVEEGRKYYRITTNETNGQTMVWGFIMKEDDKKFKKGDILKAASWSTPARNKPRGNILQDDFSWVRWTGPEYL